MATELDLDEDDDPEVEPRVARDVARLTGMACVACDQETLCGHGALLAIVLGFSNAPRCPACFARSLETSTPALLANAYAHISQRTCFSRAMALASEREGLGVGAVCIFQQATAVPAPRDHASDAAPAGVLTAEWDAGEMSCGDLVLELRGRLMALAPGEVLRVRATDPAAPLDIPAWCGMTGHTLVARHPPDRYDIRKRTTEPWPTSSA